MAEKIAKMKGRKIKMTWEASGSIGDRLRALRVRDDIIRKQEGAMGALGDAGLSGEVQGVPGPLGEEGALPAHMMGSGNHAAAKNMWLEMSNWCDAGDDILNAGQKVGTEYGSANIDKDMVLERNKRIMKVRQMIDAFRGVILNMQNEPEERALGEHDPTNMANDQTNGNLNALVQGMGGTGGAM